MKRILLAVPSAAVFFVHSGCIDNSNQVGTVDAGGSVVVIGGRGGGMENGGSGDAPGSMGGRVGGERPLIAQCTLTGAKLTVTRSCTTLADCVAVAQTKSVRLSDALEPECDILYFGIAVEAAASLQAFKLDCESAAACPPDQTRVVTEDGDSGPVLSSTPLATCQNGVCRSYLP